MGVLFAGCASIDRRIEKHQVYFDQLEAEDQAKIRQGQIDIGFEKQMVEIAMGRPAAVKTRRTAEASSDIWIYNGVRTEFVYSHSNFHYGHGVTPIGHGGAVRYGHGDLYCAPIARPKSYETARIIFEEGQVSEVEQLNR